MPGARPLSTMDVQTTGMGGREGDDGPMFRHAWDAALHPTRKRCSCIGRQMHRYHHRFLHDHHPPWHSNVGRQPSDTTFCIPAELPCCTISSTVGTGSQSVLNRYRYTTVHTRAYFFVFLLRLFAVSVTSAQRKVEICSQGSSAPTVAVMGTAIRVRANASVRLVGQGTTVSGCFCPPAVCQRIPCTWHARALVVSCLVIVWINVPKLSVGAPSSSRSVLKRRTYRGPNEQKYSLTCP